LYMIDTDKVYSWLSWLDRFNTMNSLLDIYIEDQQLIT